MSSASLAVVRRAHPDMVRVAALSAAIALNLAALLFAMRPLAPQFAAVFETSTPTIVHFMDPPPKPLPVPDMVLKPLPKPVHVPPVPVPVHVEPQVVPPVVTSEPSHNAMAMTLTPTPPTVAPPSTLPGVVSLAYRTSPLRFPAQALRMHMQGTVLLRVLVDENGKPVDVVVEQSSGYPMLDKSARDQVLAGWSFQPAMLDGHAVKAWARVPVNFTLQQL